MTKTKRLSIVPTLRCTLKCKLCSNHMPEFKNPYDVSYEDITRDISDIFELFDYIEWLQFVGGEIFLVKYMAEVYEYCLQYKDRFSKLIIETNATIPPREKEIEILRKYGENCEVMISDYGPLSKNIDKYINEFNRNGIKYRLKKYYGDIDTQHFGGWIDNTELKDLGETEEEVANLAKDCAQVRIENMHCFKGKLHRCSNSLFMTELGILTPNPYDYLDMRDETMALQEKREIINNFYTVPRKSCHYCTWKNRSNSADKRYSAAEQMK